MVHTTKKSSERLKQRTALLSVCTATFLAALKLVYSILTGSLTMLASTVDSIFDILASLMNFFSIRESAKPPDAEHKYGHGKIESLAALFQSVIIFASAGFIIYKAISSIIHRTEITHIEEGIIVMFISTIVSILLTLTLRRVAKKTNSIVLKTDSLHYEVDIYQNLGVLLTITIIYFTSWYIIDAVVGILIGFYIIRQVWRIFKQAFDCLMDHELPNELRQKMKKIILSHNDVHGIHNFRTRQAGSTKFVDFHAELSAEIPLERANIIAHEIKMIQDQSPHTEVLIHLDPYDDSKIDVLRKNKVYGA